MSSLMLIPGWGRRLFVSQCAAVCAGVTQFILWSDRPAQLPRGTTQQSDSQCSLTATTTTPWDVEYRSRHSEKWGDLSLLILVEKHNLISLFINGSTQGRCHWMLVTHKYMTKTLKVTCMILYSGIRLLCFCWWYWSFPYQWITKVFQSLTKQHSMRL